MENSFQLLDILLFAAVAGFLLFRLRSVLGRRTGNERQRPLPTSRWGVPPKQPVDAPATIDAPPVIDAVRAAPIRGASGVAALKAADPSFDEGAFLQGARGAFDIIVKAFAAGDVKALEPLLSKDVFAAFAGAIRARQDAKETLQTKVVGVKSATIDETTVEGPSALVTVKFVSDQINVTRGADGAVVEGDAERVVEKTDLWTFSRMLRASNPNWTLVATHSP